MQRATPCRGQRHAEGNAMQRATPCRGSRHAEGHTMQRATPCRGPRRAEGNAMQSATPCRGPRHAEGIHAEGNAVQRATPCRGQRHAEGCKTSTKHVCAKLRSYKPPELDADRLVMAAVASKTFVAIERGACQFMRISSFELDNTFRIARGVHAQGKDTLFDALDVVDDWAVCNLLCALLNQTLSVTIADPGLLPDAWSLHEAILVTHCHLVHLQTALRWLAHGVQHGFPCSILACSHDGLWGNFVTEHIRAACSICLANCTMFERCRLPCQRLPSINVKAAAGTTHEEYKAKGV